jgi:hypothetical protein
MRRYAQTLAVEMPDDMLDRMIGFIGYGSSTPEVVFCGLEEATTEVNYEQKLIARIRGGGPSGIMDLGGFQTAPGCEDIWAGIAAGVQSTWRPFIKLLLAIESPHRNIADIRTGEIASYQAKRWGRTNSNHLLTELFPLPKASRRAELPEYWRGRFPELCAYYRNGFDDRDAGLSSKRANALRKAISFAEQKGVLRMVVCYGKSEWGRYREVFGIADPGEDIVDCLGRIPGMGRVPDCKSGKVLIAQRGLVLFVLTYHPAAGLSTAELQAIVDLHRHLQPE